MSDARGACWVAVDSGIKDWLAWWLDVMSRSLWGARRDRWLARTPGALPTATRLPLRCGLTATKDPASYADRRAAVRARAGGVSGGGTLTVTRTCHAPKSAASHRGVGF